MHLGICSYILVEMSHPPINFYQYSQVPIRISGDAKRTYRFNMKGIQ